MAVQKPSKSIDVHSLSSIRSRSLWVLDASNEERLSAAQIAKCLVEEHGISTSRQAVNSSLKKKNGAVDKNGNGYKLMEKGRKELIKTKAPVSDSVIIVEPGKPVSAKSIGVASVFAQLKTEIRICDPYIDAHTLDVIFKNVDKKVSVRILTQTVNDKPAGIIGRDLHDLKKEGYSVEVRVYENSALHDRYLMDRANFWLSGNSLNHLGDKESFLVHLGADVHQAMSQTFEHRWKVSKVYTQ